MSSTPLFSPGVQSVIVVIIKLLLLLFFCSSGLLFCFGLLQTAGAAFALHYIFVAIVVLVGLLSLFLLFFVNAGCCLFLCLWRFVAHFCFFLSVAVYDFR